MSKHISIHKAEFHKKFYVESDDNEELLDDILSVEKFIYPLKDKNSIFLYDVENKKLISDNLDLKKLKIDNDIEAISFAGISSENIAKIKIPKKVRRLTFEGGDLMQLKMAETLEGGSIWGKVINAINLYKFVESIDERVLIEEEVRGIYNKEIPLHINDIGLSKLLEKIDASNITELTFGWVYFSDFDFKLLSKLKDLQELNILYCYNDNICDLPKNLTNLQIYGCTIQSMSEVNLDLPRLIELDFSGNAINNLDSLSILSKNIEDIDLSRNLIKSFKINELPENLEYLNLSTNLIENDLFNQNSCHKQLKYLMLSSNKLVVSASVLHRVLEVFPNLEYLELLDNKTDGVPHEFLGDVENKNCLELVQFFLEGIEFKHKEGDIKIANEKKLNNFIEVCWKENTLPIVVILSDIQYAFSKHLKVIPSFNQYQNGFYCFVEHDNCEMFLQTDKELNQVVFRVQSENSATVALYFHKFLQELNNIITFNSHKNVLPLIKNSKSCEFLKDFYQKAFKIDFKIKSNNILKPLENGIEILINNRSIDGDREEGKSAEVIYEKIKNISFILISGKSAYTFFVKEKYVTNKLKENSDYYSYITLRTSTEKLNYIKGITNKYLNSFGLVETDVFIDNDIKKKVSCFINENNVFVKNGNLSIIDPSLVLEEKHLVDIKMDNGKWCEFDIKHNFIGLKYVM